MRWKGCAMPGAPLGSESSGEIGASRIGALVGGPTGEQKGAADTAWTPVGAEATNSGREKRSGSVPMAIGTGGWDGGLCGSGEEGGRGGAGLVETEASGSIERGEPDGASAGGGISVAARGRSAAQAAPGTSKSSMMEFMKGGRETSAFGAGAEVERRGVGMSSGRVGGESARWYGSPGMKSKALGTTCTP